ncbi:MAG TPA: type II secretion system protein GspM [Casimicrobiaceae bacterium]
MATTTTPASGREAIAQWWHLRSQREKRALAALSAAIALALAWLVVWQPLLADSDRLARRLPADRAALADARRASDEIVGLARAAAAPAPSDPRAALDGVLAARNLGKAATAIERIDNDRLRVTFDTIGFDGLTALLDALQRDAHLRAVEVVATARVEAGLVRADVTLTR